MELCRVCLAESAITCEAGRQCDSPAAVESVVLCPHVHYHMHYARCLQLAQRAAQQPARLTGLLPLCCARVGEVRRALRHDVELAEQITTAEPKELKDSSMRPSTFSASQLN